MTLQLPACVSHLPLSREPLAANFLRVSREIALIFIAHLIPHQLNTKPNTIKSHKTQGTKLIQLQHFLLWNKVNIKHSCKSQLYNHKLVKFTILKSNWINQVRLSLINLDQTSTTIWVYDHTSEFILSNRFLFFLASQNLHSIIAITTTIKYKLYTGDTLG